MASLMLKSAAAAGLGMVVETKYGPKLSSTGLAAYAVTPLILIGTGFWSITHGVKVGRARTIAIEAAKADGESEVEERYDLPNLYAQGTSKHAQTFNAIQRSHQHIFETFPTVVLSSLIGAVSFPISSALSTVTYAIGRVAFSNAYSESDGDASKRYSSKLSKYMWYGMLMNVILGASSCICVMVLERTAKSYFSPSGMMESVKESSGKYLQTKNK